MSEIFIKFINRGKTRFSVNGKFVSLNFDFNNEVVSFSSEFRLSKDENLKFREYLRSIELIS